MRCTKKHSGRSELRCGEPTDGSKLCPRHRRQARRRTWTTQGIDPDAAEEVLENHDGTCDCCGADHPGGRGGWHVDHDHETGEIRGVLCTACNTGIGLLGDDLGGLLQAVAYLAHQGS